MSCQSNALLLKRRKCPCDLDWEIGSNCAGNVPQFCKFSHLRVICANCHQKWTSWVIGSTAPVCLLYHCTPGTDSEHAEVTLPQWFNKRTRDTEAEIDHLAPCGTLPFNQIMSNLLSPHQFLALIPYLLFPIISNSPSISVLNIYLSLTEAPFIDMRTPDLEIWWKIIFYCFTISI